ncbi:MAG: hypothetical protein ACI9FR_002829 [Cryomorphaceae bacterium]|jgi:hypothetical protein
MQFLALIYNTEGSDDIDWDTLIDQYRKFGEQAETARAMLGGRSVTTNLDSHLCAVM